jgi:hypothetical protein
MLIFNGFVLMNQFMVPVVSAVSPTVTTNTTTDITESSVTLNGYLSADGGSEVSVWFEYGLSTGYGSVSEKSYYNYSADFSSGEHTIDGSFDCAKSVYACDVDGDGDVDVLGTGSFPHDTITWWENDGSESFTEHTIDGSFNGANSVYACDVDGDGDVDVLGAAYIDDEIAWWENDGSESFTKHTIAGSFNGAYDVYACDVDGDGDVDVLGAAYIDDDITWWENDGSESFTKHTIAGSFNGAYDVYACDVDGDGDVDVLGAARDADEIAWWENDGSESFTEHTIAGSFNYAESVYACDVDGDGDVDVLGAAKDADDITWWENSGITSYDNTLFSKTITGLSPGTTYHYRSVSENSDGTSYGSDMTFTTAMPQDNTTNGTTYLSLTSNDQDTSYYPVNRTIPSESPWLEYNNISFNPLLDYTTNVTLVVPVSSNNAIIFNVTNNTCGSEATSVSDMSSLTNNTYWYDSGNQLLYIRTINVTTATSINWSIYSGEEYSFYLEIPQYLDVGDYFMAQGLITDALTDNPASGVIAKTYLYESGNLAFGPVQWHCVDGNFQTVFSTNTLEPGTYSVDIVFENETSGNTYHYGSNLYLSTDTPISGVYKNAVVHISWYNTNYGLGLPDETLKLFIDDERKHSMTFYTYTGNTINITVKDYYNSTLYTGNHTITDTTTNIDLGLTFHSWLFGNKNEEYYMISLRKENGSRWWERGIVPGGEREYLIPSGNYSMRIYDADYNEIYNTSDHGGNISVVNSRVYVIEGSNLSEVISGQSVIQGQLLELSDSLDYALTPDATYYSYNPTVVFSVWDKKGMLLGNDIWSICPPLHVVATTYNEQYAGNTTLSLLAPGNGTRNGTITIENDIVYFSGTADYVNISYTNGTLIQNTSYVPNRVTLSGGDIMINASNNISIFRETVYGQVTKFDWNVYNSSTNPGHIQGRAGYHQAGIEINNPLDVPIYDVYVFAAFTDKTNPDVNTVRVYDVANGAVLESGDGYKTTEDGIDFKITGGLSAGSERGYTLSYYSDQTTTSTYKDVMLHARSYQEDKPFNDEYYNYAEVRWSNTGSETFLGGFRVKLDFNMDVDKDSVIVEDLDNSQLVDSGDYIVGDEFLWIGNNAIGSISPGGTRGFGFYFQEELYPGQNTKELHLNTEIFSFLGLSWTPFLIIFLLSCIPIGLGAVWIVRKGRIKTGYLAPIVLGVFIMLIFYILQAKGV